MDQKSVFIVSGWIVSVGLAFAIGLSTARRSTSPSGDHPAVTVPSQTSELREETPPTPTPRRRALARHPAPYPTAAPSSLATQGDPAARRAFSAQGLRSSLNNPDPVQGAIDFAALLQTIDETNIRRAVEIAREETGRSSDRRNELSLLLYKWGTLDGEAAVAYVQDMDRSRQQHRYMYHVLTGWATAEPDAAVTWAQDNFEGKDNPHLPGVIKGVAMNDLQRATDLAHTLPYGRIRGHAANALVEESLRNGVARSVAWAEALPDGRLKNGIVSRVASQYAKEDPYAAADWELSLQTDSQKLQTVSTIARRWVHDDGQGAATWASELSDTTLRNKGVSTAVGHWSHHDPTAAAGWLDEQPASASKDLAIQAYANTIQSQDPEYALQWAGTIGDAEKKREAIGKIYETWLKRDPAKARRFFGEQ